MALRCLRASLRRSGAMALLSRAPAFCGGNLADFALVPSTGEEDKGGWYRHSAFGEPAWNLRREVHTSCQVWDAVSIVVPPMGDSVTEGSVAGILKQPGDVVAEDEVIAQIETDKVTIDVRYTGTTPAIVKTLLVKEEDTVVVGQAVAQVEEAEGGVPIEQPTAGKDIEGPPAPPPPETPVKAAAPEKPQETPSSSAPSATESSTLPQMRPERRVKMTRLRKRVSERLKGAQNTYAMLSTFNEIDMTNIMEMRSQYKELFQEKHGVKLGFMSAFVKASVFALKDIPAVNGVIEDDEIVYREYVDISFAVATPKGLVVPVLRNTENMTFADVEKSIVSMGVKARDGTLSIDEMAGGTFTISNGGVYGSLLSTPIINPPQSAILGMHSIQKRPMVVGKEILPRPMMYVALTYDHRLIDGREAVTFLRRIKDLIEDPRRFLLDI